MSTTYDLCLRDAHVVTCDGPLDAAAPGRLAAHRQAAIGILNGRVAWLGSDSDAPSARRTIALGGRVVLPGLVDPHTHLVFAGSRVEEFARRMAGEDYQVIAREGGGIKATVRWSREASDEALYEATRARALAMRARGVTALEIKSGYGLETYHELRHLQVARRLGQDGVARVTTSLLGAHAVPAEYAGRRAEYVREVTEQMVPAAAAQGLADACDVYLDEGAFTRAEAEQVLRAARDHGLAVRAHVGQFADLGGAELAAELGARSADHLEAVSDAGLRAMARAGVVAVLLPGAWRTLRQTAPDAARMRAHGVRIAIGTDCNPGTSPSVDLPLMAALAVRDAGMTLEEAILGVTVEAAAAAGLPDSGRIRVGGPADLAVFDALDPRSLGYAIGGTRAALVLLDGEIVHENPFGAPLW